MDNPCPTIVVDGYRCTGDDLDLSSDDAWGLALDQRAFGPRRLLVVTAREDGRVLGLAHCQRTDPPELALTCCLDLLDDGTATAAIAYSDEPVAPEPPPDIRQRLEVARMAAAEYGVHLIDWVMCDDINFRSARFTLDEPEHRWARPGAGD
jgi:hypothetical protein